MPSNRQSHEKPNYHHGNLKPTLVAVARTLVESNGHEQLTLRAVAEQAKVSQTAIYRHFQSKDALLGGVLMDGMRDLEAQTSEALHSNASPMQRFHDVGSAYVAFAKDNPRLYALMFDKVVHNRGCDEVKVASESAFAVLKSAISDCQQVGVIRPGSVDQQAFAIWAAVHGMVTLCRDQAPTVAPQATLESGYEMIWEWLVTGIAVQSVGDGSDLLRSS